MSDKDDDAALLTQGKEEDAGRQKIDRKDGLVFKLSDYYATQHLVPRKRAPIRQSLCGQSRL